jgi:flagellar hook-associated protein 1 FlgK
LKLSLFTSLRSAADSLGTFQRALTVTQNNVSNASTPGYARQIQGMTALPFDARGGLAGGVAAAEPESTRDPYAEQAVRRQVEALGSWEQKVDSLSPLDTSFNITGDSGVPGALNTLYQAFNAWSVAPNDAPSRQSVLNSAQNVALAFQQAGNTLARTSADADAQLRGLVDKVNTLAGRLHDYNVQRKGRLASDPALDANIHDTLEQLSEVAGIQAIQQPDGSMTVLLGGQTPLVVGEFQYKIGLSITTPSSPPPTNASGPPTAFVTDATGRNITSQITEGRLAGLLDVRNRVIPSLRGDSSQPGSLNRMAQSFADRINSLLTSGNISDGPPPVPGVPLFTYDASNPSSIAQTIAVDPAVTPSRLAAISSGPPAQSNGIALQLASLAAGQDPASKIDGLSYQEFYGNMAGQVGAELATAQTNQSLYQDLASQARTLRQQTSGVSLDAEAINVLQFQRAYEAAAKMVTVLDSLTQTVVNLLQ